MSRWPLKSPSTISPASTSASRAWCRRKLVPEARKLLKLTLSLGGDQRRTVFAGIKQAYEPEPLVGRLVVMVANLAPRVMRFGISEGMVVAAGPGGSDVSCWVWSRVPCRVSESTNFHCADSHAGKSAAAGRPCAVCPEFPFSGFFVTPSSGPYVQGNGPARACCRFTGRKWLPYIWGNGAPWLGNESGVARPIRGNVFMYRDVGRLVCTPCHPDAIGT